MRISWGASIGHINFVLQVEAQYGVKFVSKGLGNGNIRAGLSYTLAPSYSDADYAKTQISRGGVFQLPIILEYAFF